MLVGLCHNFFTSPNLCYHYLFIYYHNTYAIEIDSGLIVVCMRHMERSSDVVVVVVVVLIVVRRATVTLLLLRF